MPELTIMWGQDIIYVGKMCESSRKSVKSTEKSVKFTNKRPMGHIAHLRKQFKSINTYDYIITLIKRRKNNINLESTSPKDALCQDWLKLAQWFWRRRLFNFVNVFSLFRNYVPLEKDGALHLYKLESPSPRDTLCQVWL